MRDLEEELKLAEQKKNRLVQQRNKLWYVEGVTTPPNSCNLYYNSS